MGLGAEGGFWDTLTSAKVCMRKGEMEYSELIALMPIAESELNQFIVSDC